jgi:hypothetical protein
VSLSRVEWKEEDDNPLVIPYLVRAELKGNGVKAQFTVEVPRYRYKQQKHREKTIEELTSEASRRIKRLLEDFLETK